MFLCILGILVYMNITSINQICSIQRAEMKKMYKIATLADQICMYLTISTSEMEQIATHIIININVLSIS